MRAEMTPEEVRAAGIYLNGGRRRGWRRRLAALLMTPEATIAAWATRSAGNARPIPGVAALALRLLVAMMRQQLMADADPRRAIEVLSLRLAALARTPEPLAAPRFEVERVLVPEPEALPAPAIAPLPKPLARRGDRSTGVVTPATFSELAGASQITIETGRRTPKDDPASRR